MPVAATDHRRALADILLRGHGARIFSTPLARPVQQRLIEQAIEQRVGVLCFEQIVSSDLSPRFDTDLLAKLRLHAVAESVLDVHRQHCLREVLTALGKAGINTLLFKGSALALSHYPQSYLRPRDDSDILTDKRHLAALNRVLTRLGFQRAVAHQQSLIQHQCLYWRRDSNGCLHNLDIHWALSNRRHCSDATLSLASLRNRAMSIPELGDHALTPNSVDAVLIACQHLATHHAGEIRLIWLYDLLLLVEALTPELRQQLVTAIDHLDLAEACRLGLGLTAYYFSVPGSVLSELVPVPVDPDTLPQPRRWQVWRADMATLPHLTDRLRYLSQHLFPTPRYLLERAAKISPLWLPWLYLRRTARGIHHLWQR